MRTEKLKNAIYLWQGTQQGMKVNGEIPALSMNLAKVTLTRQGIQVSSLKKKPHDPWLKTKANTFDIILFFRQLSTLILAGVPLTQAIHILRGNTEQKKLLTVMNTIHEDISAGKGLGFSLQKFPHYFDLITCCLVQAGEKTGTLDIMLNRIASYKEKNFLLKNKIKQALFYPVIILVVALAVSLILLICVVPRFADLFQQVNRDLPAFTQAVIHLSTFIKHYFWFMVIGLVGVSFSFYYSLKFARVKNKLDYYMLQFPALGILLKKTIIIRITRNLATLFKAGVPIIEALKIINNTTGNLYYTHAIDKISQNISIGKQLHTAMLSSKLFPSMVLQLIQVGEESGTLEKMLEKTADFYEADVDQAISYLSRLLEPLIMLILGVLIGGLLVAMYLPIFKLGTTI